MTFYKELCETTVYTIIKECMNKKSIKSYNIYWVIPKYHCQESTSEWG